MKIILEEVIKNKYEVIVVAEEVVVSTEELEDNTTPVTTTERKCRSKIQETKLLKLPNKNNARKLQGFQQIIWAGNMVEHPHMLSKITEKKI